MPSMAAQRHRLPDEILLMIAHQCLDSFSDQELWFRLGRVSRLFRDVVERHATTDKSTRSALCVMIEPLPEKEIDELQCTVVCSVDSCLIDVLGYNSFAFHQIDPDDRSIAIFRGRREMRLSELELAAVGVPCAPRRPQPLD